MWFRTAQGFDAAALSAENAAKLREPEVEDLVRSVDCARVVSRYYDTGNWCVVAEKL